MDLGVYPLFSLKKQFNILPFQLYRNFELSTADFIYENMKY
jgi:hypothetical protein